MTDFEDPRGEYPTPKYWNSSSLNKEVTGEEKTTVDAGGGDPGISAFGGHGEPVIGLDAFGGKGEEVGLDAFGGAGPNIAPEYGKIQVQESVSGHKTVIDDTPGAERMLFRHKTGAGIEMSADGSVSIRSRNNMVIAIDAEGGIIIEGDFRISSKNLQIDVTGDLDLNVTGDFNTTVAGTKTETVYGNHRTNVSGNQAETITGSKSETVLASQTNTVLGTLTDVTKGDRNVTTGGSSTMSVGGTFKASAQGEYTLAAPSMNISAGDMSILAAQGTIGGANVIMYNYNMYTGHTVYAGDTVSAPVGNLTRTNGTSAHYTTFHGDLNGTANSALEANVAAGTGGGGASVTSSTATNIADDTKASYQPDAALMKQILSYSTRGVNEVSIDSKDYIRNKIDRTAKMGGIANRKLTPNEARMKLKDANNAANKDFIAALVADGSVSDTYFSQKIAPAIGRTYSGPGSVSYSTGDGAAANYYVTGDRKFSGFSPDSKYNPQNIDPRNGPLAITPKTLVGAGIPISTFLGSRGFATNLNHLATLEERQTLARQLLLQAEVIKIARENKDKFRGFRINVAEGVYKKMPNEQLEEGSILDLAQTGRAITYELYDSKNASYNEITFEFAEYLAEYLTGYDKIIVSYDTLDPRVNEMQSQITVIMPEVDKEFKIVGREKPEYKLKSDYNGKSISETDLVEVDPYGNAIDETAIATAEEAKGIIEYQLGSIRNRKVNPSLERILAGAAKAAKVDTVVIKSGKQPGTTGRRIGSARHDTGNAADFYLVKGGRILDSTRPGDRKIMADFMTASVKLGIRGGGHSSGYMGTTVTHLDTLGALVTATSWDSSRLGLWRSDSWFEDAMKAGMS